MTTFCYQLSTQLSIIKAVTAEFHDYRANVSQSIAF